MHAGGARSQQLHGLARRALRHRILNHFGLPTSGAGLDRASADHYRQIVVEPGKPSMSESRSRCVSVQPLRRGRCPRASLP